MESRSSDGRSAVQWRDRTEGKRCGDALSCTSHRVGFFTRRFQTAPPRSLDTWHCASRLGARMQLGAPGLTTKNKKLVVTSATLVVTGALLVVTRMQLGAPGLTRSTDAQRLLVSRSWPLWASRRGSPSVRNARRKSQRTHQQSAWLGKNRFDGNLDVNRQRIEA